MDMSISHENGYQRRIEIEIEVEKLDRNLAKPELPLHPKATSCTILPLATALVNTLYTDI